MTTPQQAASTATPWMADHTHGLVCPAGWLKIRSVRSAEPKPWLSTVNTTFHRNGTQSCEVGQLDRDEEVEVGLDRAVEQFTSTAEP